MRCDDAMAHLKTAVAAFRERDQGALTSVARGEELRELRAVIDSLEGEFCASAQTFRVQGGHLVDGACTAVGWIGRACQMSSTAAADRLCVGQELESLPRVAEALSQGEIGFQSAAALCHLRDKLGDQRELFVEAEMLEMARRLRVKDLRTACLYARHIADPDGFFKEAEDNHERRRLQISQLADGTHFLDAVLDAEGGAAVRTVLESLARRAGADDRRSHPQRLADALVETAYQVLDGGRLPRHGGVRPHVTVTTTLEGLKNQLGAPAADLELSLPISTRTLERLACDCTLSRVLLADSMVIDVGRATRIVSAPTRRALRARDRGCRWPGCDRSIDLTSPHHIIAWANGGPSKLGNLVSVCYYHHRLVHEGGWQVVKAGSEFRFLPPDRDVFKLARGPGVRWAA
jgi:Domain of unknown function (DUF222)